MRTPPVVSKIFEYSLFQAIKWLESEYSKVSTRKLTSQLVAGPSALRQLSPELDRPDGPEKQSKLEYPFALMAIGDISLDGNRSGFNKAKYREIVTRKDLDTNKAFMLNMRPVRVGIGVNFRTSDLKEFLALTHLFMMNGPAVSLILRVANTEFKIMNKLTLPESVTAPPVNYESPGEAYMYEGILTLDTWMATEYEQGLITGIRFSVSHADAEEVFFDGEVDDETPIEKLISRNINFTDMHNRKTKYLEGDR